ncbi:MAG: class I SAM-dependent methyltransferase [Caldiserica bacterium]|nr:class I SAM-dependent methyltransferase [Caldisericota bacterium]
MTTRLNIILEQLNTGRKFFLLPFRLFLEKYLLPGYNLRKAQALIPLLPKNVRLLDVGCGGGEVSYYLKNLAPSLEIVGLEVRKPINCRIPLIVYDGKRIPFQDNAFDGILLIDVLHHAEDIPRLLKECKRVGKWVIVLEHPYFSFLSYLLLSAGDILFNFAFASPTSLHFKKTKQWRELFSQEGFKIEKEVKNLYLGGRVHTRYNFLVKLRK